MVLTLEADRSRQEEPPVAKPKKPDYGNKRAGREPGAERVVSDETGTLADDVPYLSWAAATNYRDLGSSPDTRSPKVRIPLLLELTKPAVGFADAVAKLDLGKVVDVPPLFAKPSAGLEGVTFCTASVEPSFFTSSAARTLADQWIKRIEFGLPGLALPQIPPPTASGGGGVPAKVVMAVMDDAVPFVHRRFHHANGEPRVEYVWKQGAPGVLVTRADIKAAISANTHAGILDEDAVYRSLQNYEHPAAQGHKALWRRGAHGAHIMDLAFGRDPSHETTPPIVGVQFPADAIRDTSGAWLTPHVYLGLRFILEAADLLAAAQGSGPLPVVVNVSYGKFADSHDGLSVLEAAMDQLIENRRKVAPFSVVLPSGNSFLARCHAELRLAPGEQRTLRWRVQPDDRTPSFLEIWPGPVSTGGAAPKLRVTVTPPDGGAAKSVTRGQRVDWGTAPQLIARAEYRKPTALGPHRDMILVTLSPTAPLVATDKVAPAGTWEVTVENEDTGTTADIHAWIQRDDTPYGWPITGRQSRFDDPAYERFHPAGTYDRATAAGIELWIDNNQSYVKRAGSLNAIATGEQPVVIAAYCASDATVSAYSSGGPIPPGIRSGPTPDAAAVGDDSPVCDGVLAAGTRRGSAVAMRGTSIAAPQIARWLAIQMEKGLAADRAAVQGLAAALDPVVPPAPPERIGAGRVDVRPPPRVKRRDV
jgi:hypothetical protein